MHLIINVVRNSTGRNPFVAFKLADMPFGIRVLQRSGTERIVHGRKHSVDFLERKALSGVSFS